MLNLKTKTYFKFIFIVSLISIISAYFIEYVLGHQPCNLCLIERIPYILSIFLLIIIYILKRYEKFFILLFAIMFICSLIISIYHFGIEQGFFKESAVCSLKSAFEVISKDELLLQLNNKPVSCKDVTFRIFGLSLTSINIILNIFLIILTLKALLNYEKFKKKN